MGISKTDDELGREPSKNGSDPIYYPPNWRYSIINERPKNVRTKKAVVLFSIDIIGLFILIGIVKKMTDAKEIIALIVAIWWVGGRAVIITVKVMSFMGKNSESIKKGIKTLKELFGND